MSKRSTRPWDKSSRVSKLPTFKEKVAADPLSNARNKDKGNYNGDHGSNKNNEDVPFIEVDKIKYYSDRFYLNCTIYEDEDDSDVDSYSPGNVDGRTAGGVCHCGSKQPLPLFDRRKLITSLDLQAVILGTFSLDIDYLKYAFPSLFGPSATIPTLVMHGKKGWTLEKDDQHHHEQDVDDEPGSEPSWTPPRNRKVMVSGDRYKQQSYRNNICDYNDEELLLSTQEEESHDGVCSILTQEQFSSPLIDKIQQKSSSKMKSEIPNQVDHDLAEKDTDTTDLNIARNANEKESTSRNNSENLQSTTSRIGKSSFPCTVHFSEVQTLWSRAPPPRMVSAEKTALSNNNKQDGTIHRNGVHHPKFMILMEKSGSIVIVVTTANLTRPTTTDASWIQRFPPLQQGPYYWSGNVKDGSDFGLVLTDFLHWETMATRQEHMSAVKFVQTYCQWKSLKDLQNKFDFSKSQVHLIPVVPGDYESAYRIQQKINRINEQNDSIDEQLNKKKKALECETKIYLYGRQRIQHVLEKLCRGHNPSIPPNLLSDQDRLIFQPTSFGAEWKQSNMAELIRSYMISSDTSINHRDYSSGSSKSIKSEFTNQYLLERLDIVWPTETFVERARKIRKRKNSPKAVYQYNIEFSPTKINEVVKLSRANEGYLFLSSDVFNSTDLSCLSQMVMFEPSYPAQQSRALVPHIKSVCRLFEGNDYRLRKDFSVMKCEEYFSWFLLTSACLSRGAQGEDTVGRSPDSDAVSYSNFELGVLFTSRLNNTRSNRLYCWNPSQCSCWAKKHVSSSTRVIHLPIPYSLRPSRYQEDADEADFCETPYFHEISPGTGCVGHMRLTPYGIRVANEYKKAGL